MSNEADISKLRIVVESKTDGIVDKLTSLASALETLKNASKGSFKGLENCAKAISNLADAVSKINDEDIDRLERMANAVQKMSGVKFSSSFVRAMGSMSGSTKGGAMTVGSKFSSGRGWAWNDNGSGSGSAVFLGGGGSGSGGGYPPIDIGGLFGSGRRGGSFSIPAIFTKFKAKMSGFLGSILRIAMYRLIRRALMLIVNAFKEGLKNAKEWSRINNTQLYESMKRLSAAGLAMKNALGAALGELLISIQPALEWVALKIADIGNSLANMLATLRRSDTYQKAITDINKLAEAQERYNRALLGFDEIHKLTAQENVNDYFTMEETDKTQAGYSIAKVAGIATLAVGLKALLSNGSIGSLFGKIASWFGGGAAASGSTLTPFLQSVFGGGNAAGGTTIFSKIGTFFKNGAAKVSSWFGGGASGSGAGGAGAASGASSIWMVIAKIAGLATELVGFAVADGYAAKTAREMLPELQAALDRYNRVTGQNVTMQDIEPGGKVATITNQHLDRDVVTSMRAYTDMYNSMADSVANANVGIHQLSSLESTWLQGAAEIVLKEQTPSGYEKEVARFTYGDIINNRVGRIMVNTSMTR